MKILAIETSCDETGASIVEDPSFEALAKEDSAPLTVLSNIVASSEDMHTKTGGIIPENAAREQIKSIIPVIDEALKIANCKIENLTALAVTVGPGLIGSLLVGVETAKTLSYLWNKPIIPVNHLLGHIYANFLPNIQNTTYNIPKFPLLALVVSGGHTDMVYLKSVTEIKYIGGTRDDAAGEAFDKCARLLRLPYPGGPSIAKAAAEFIEKSPNEKLTFFPRPMLDSKDFDFSFSGLKTAVSNYILNHKPLTINHRSQLAAEVQEAIVDTLVAKSIKAIEKYNPKSFLLGGGVAANQRLREKLQNAVNQTGSGHNIVTTSGNVMRADIHVPEPKLCTDNAAAIAAAAFMNYKPKPVNWQDISVNPELTITSKF